MGPHPQEPSVHVQQRYIYMAQVTVALFVLKPRNNPNVHQHSNRPIIYDLFTQRNAIEYDEELPLPCYMDESHRLLLEKRSQIQWFYLYEVHE